MHGMETSLLDADEESDSVVSQSELQEVATNILWGARRRALARSVVVASSDR